MLKKLVVCVFVVVFALSFTSCKKKDDKAAKEEFGKKIAVLMDESSGKILNAEDAAGVAAALNEFADAKEELMKGCCESKKGKECDSKKGKGDCDKNCKEFCEKIKPQVEKYKDDPEVEKALQRFGCEEKQEKSK